jgi:hypothetical protein
MMCLGKHCVYRRGRLGGIAPFNMHRQLREYCLPQVDDAAFPGSFYSPLAWSALAFVAAASGMPLAIRQAQAVPVR